MAVSFLTGAVRSRRFANGYIFSGPDGVGKRLTAINFAKAANCESEDLICHGCPSCIKIDSSNHPDVRVVRAEKDGGSIGIDAIRSVIEDAALKPYEALTRFYIVDEADSMTEEAANALLKTLEEPSTDSVLILISRNMERLYPTVRSRCQVVKFFLLDPAVIEDILTVSHKEDKTRSRLLANVSGGSMSQALRLKDEEYFEKREEVISALSKDLVLDLEFDKASRSDLRAILNIMLTWYRDILVAKAGGPAAVNIDEIDTIAVLAKKLSFEKLDGILKKIISTQTYLEQNANPKLAMTALALAL